MLELLRRFLKWLLRLLGTEIEVSPTKEATAETETAPRPEITTPAPLLPKITAPELRLATPESPQYRKSKSLFTDYERVFYGVLLEAVKTDYQVFAKVRMADFVWLANEPADRKFHNSQILCKHVDFLLCDKESLRPLLVIELDDNSHRKYDRRESDEFKNKTFAAIGLPIKRITVQAHYSTPELHEQIRSVLQENGVK
jgi:very-short-patch-repair endonuclease